MLAQRARLAVLEAQAKQRAEAETVRALAAREGLTLAAVLPDVERATRRSAAARRLLGLPEKAITKDYYALLAAHEGIDAEALWHIMLEGLVAERLPIDCRFLTRAEQADLDRALALVRARATDGER